jgi:hypothetical protein
VKRALATLALVCGCSPGTEVVVHISSVDLIPAQDFQKICINVNNPPSPSPIYQSQDLTVCAPNTKGDCFSLPISVTLTPGPSQPHAGVRVEVDAVGRDISCASQDAQQRAVTTDASVFHFVSGHSERLDFFLYKSCINQNCAVNDNACNSNGQCVPLSPTGATVADMAMPAADSSMASDLAIPANADLSPGTLLLGDTKIEGLQDFHPPGMAQATQYPSLPGGGTVRHLTFYLDNNDAATVLLGLYDDSGGHPSRLLAQGMVLNPATYSARWYTVDVPATAISGNTPYWLVGLVPLSDPGRGLNFRYARNTPPTENGEHDSRLDLTVLPATWSSGSLFPNTTISSYASE